MKNFDYEMYPSSLKGKLNQYQKSRNDFLKYNVLKSDKNFVISEFKVIRDDKYALMITYLLNERPILLAWAGTKHKPSTHKRYISIESREEAIQKLNESISNKETKTENEGHQCINIGDIFVSSWGYEQTNIDFYEVTGKKGKSTLLLREIFQNRTYEKNGMSGKCSPIPGKYLGNEIIKKRFNSRFKCVTFNSYKSARLIEKKVIAGVEVLPSFSWSAWY